MKAAITFRPLTEKDGPAFAGLSYSCEDEGRIHYAANYKIDAVQAVRALHGEDMQGVAACARSSQRLVGVGLIRFGQCLYEGELLPFALLGNLIVHPDYRGKGLALQLAERQLEMARARIGDQGVVLANYQHGNLASERIFGRWLKSSAGPLAYIPMRTLQAAPAPLPHVLTGPLDPTEHEEFVMGLNDFYTGHNFHRPETADSLNDLCQNSPFPTPFRHAYTAVDAGGCLLAGLIAMEEYRLKEMEVRDLSTPLRLLNRVGHFLPNDQAVREVYLDHIWYLPGQAQAARHLVDTVRWIWSNRAHTVSVFIDPRGPLREIFPTRPWSIVARSVVAAQGPVPLNPNKLVCPIY